MSSPNLHTFIISDIHLADAEPGRPKQPLWKKFKKPEFFIDAEFKSFLEYLSTQTQDPIELILNGDIFDFDSVLKFPVNKIFDIDWLERLRGLDAEEDKSQFKMKTILETHPIWISALRDFVSKGNQVIFVIGNHDLELHWHSVQKVLTEALTPQLSQAELIRFVEWFYISNEDTLVEHGNQYDAYCVCSNPINPAIKKYKSFRIRLPFGNLAGKYMLNGMGLLNPHSESSFIKSSLWQYFVFYYKYVIRIQPFLMYTWLWSSITTLFVNISEGLHPSLSDPLTIAERIEEIAKKSKGTTGMVLGLRELHSHPVYFSPLKVFRELWLDRALLFLVILSASFQFFVISNLFAKVSLWFFIIPLVVMLPVYVFYAGSVNSEVLKCLEEIEEKLPTAAKIARVKRAVFGHTHIHEHRMIEDVEYLNTGTWSPAYHDIECTQPYGKKCFAWLKPGKPGRTAELYEWKDSAAVKIESVHESR